MSTRNLIGSSQSSAHPLLIDSRTACSVITQVVANITRMYNVYPVYARGIWYDVGHAMILVSWIETFIF